MSAFDPVLFVFPDVDGFRVAIVGCVLPGPGHATRKAALLAGRAEARTRFIAALCRITLGARPVHAVPLIPRIW